MKTVIDEVMNAVSKLRGDWAFHDDRISLVWECTDNVTGYHVGQIVIGLESYDTDCYRFICNRKEFLATVAECETNFGECNQSYSDYKFDYHLHPALKQNKPTKELDMDIDIDNLKETKSKLFQLIQNLLGYHRINDDQQEYIYEIVGRILKSCNIEAKPQPTPIFTQEMVDNAVLPGVGMECLINFPDIDNAWYKYTIDYIGKHTFIASCKDVSERFGHVDDVYFKPLTPPITLIDGKAYQFDKDKKTFIGLYHKNENEFITLATYSDASNCTNIQPLTVEVK